MKTETVESFAEAYVNSDSEGMFGVMEKKNYFWNKDSKLISPWPEGQAVMNTKFVEETYEAAHCLYAGRMDKIGEGIWMGDFNKPGDIELFPMEEKECLDIDYQWQFDMCEALYKSGVR
jgi:CMP-N-acetylneuraminic acid synthetase